MWVFTPGSYVLSLQKLNQGGFTKEEEKNRLWGRQLTVSALDNQTHPEWLVSIYREF